jgi:hypothetical protein
MLDRVFSGLVQALQLKVAGLNEYWNYTVMSVQYIENN